MITMHGYLTYVRDPCGCNLKACTFNIEDASTPSRAVFAYSPTVQPLMRQLPILNIGK